MNLKHFYTIILLTIILKPTIFAQPNFFDQIVSTEQGNSLSQNSVYTIVQDNFGFMWFGTQAGLERFDGQYFEHYYHNPQDSNSITRGNVRALCKAKNGVWVGTEKGLSLVQYNNKLKNFKVIRLVENKTPFLHLFSLDENSIIAVTDYNCLKISFGGDKELLVDTLTLANDKILAATYNSANENLILGIGKKIKRYILQPDNTVLKDSTQVFNKKISALYFTPNNSLLIAASNAVYHVLPTDNLNNYQPFQISNAPQSIKINSFFQDNKDNLWIGTRNSGLLFREKGQNKFHPIKHNPLDRLSLSSNLIYSLYESRDSVIWIGTNGGGINKYASKKQYFQSITQIHKNVPFNNGVWAMEKIKNKLYVGTRGNHIAVYNHQNLENHAKNSMIDSISFHNKEDYGNNTFLCLKKENDQSLLIGTASGLYRFPLIPDSFLIKEKHKIYPKKPKETISVSSIKKVNNKWYVGTRDKGLFIFDENFEQPLISPKSQLQDLEIYTLATNQKSNKLWVGTANGLYIYNQEKNELDTVPIKISGQSIELEVFSLHHQKINDKEYLWIGTYGNGLIKIEFNAQNKAIIRQQFNRNNKLPDNAIYGILADQYDNLWVGTNRGISKINPSLNIVNNYSVLDGLQNDEFNLGAFLLDEDVLFFGGVSGFTWFKPLLFNNNNTKLEFAYQYFATDETGQRFVLEPRGNEKDIHIPYSGKEIDFRYSIFDYHHPKNNCIEYNFKNRKTETENTINNNQLRITGTKSENKKPYLVFHNNDLILKFRSSYGNWEEHKKQKVSIKIGPNWFLILIGLITFLSAFSYWKNSKKTKAYQKVNESLETKTKALTNSTKEIKLKAQELSTTNENLTQLQKLLNEVNRQETKKDISQSVLQHLTSQNYFFKFHFAIIYFFEGTTEKIADIDSLCANEKIVPPPQNWRPENEDKWLTIKENDILERVHKDLAIAKIENETITIIEGNWKRTPELDKDVFKKSNHQNIKRIFLPIIRRANPKAGQREGDFPIGVLEVGYHIDSPKQIEENLLNLKLYVDNCAQVFYQVKMKSLPEDIEAIIRQSQPEENHKKFMHNILTGIAKMYNCNQGDLAYSTFGENQSNWQPKITEWSVYNIAPEKLKQVRNGDFVSKKQKPNGIFKQVLKTKDFYYTGNVKKDKYYLAGLENATSQLSVILKSESKIVGTMNLYSEKPNFFNDIIAQNIQRLAHTASDIYIRKRTNYYIKNQLLPINIFLARNTITVKIINLLTRYFSSQYVGLWEKSIEKEGVFEFAKGTKTINTLLTKDKDLKQIQDTLLPKEIRSYVFEVDKKLSEQFPMLQIFMKKNEFKAVIFQPIHTGSILHGFFVILTKIKLESIFLEDQNLLSQISNKYSTAIQSEKLFDSFTGFSELMAEGNFKEEDIFQNIVDKATDIFKADFTVIFQKRKTTNLNEAFISKYSRTSKLKQPITKTEADAEPNKENIVDNILKENRDFYIKNDQEYLEAFGSKEDRSWESKKWKKDFWEREGIKAMAAMPLTNLEKKPIGVVFLNYKQKRDTFNEDFKILFRTFALLASRAILNARLLQENRGIKDITVKLTKSIIETYIVNSLAHNTGNLVNALLRRLKEFEEEIKKLKNKRLIEKSIVTENIENIREPIEELNRDYLNLRHFRKSGEKVYFKDNVSISKLIEEVFRLLRSRAIKHKVILIKKLESDPPITCDVNYIKHALINLLFNAMDAIGTGGKITVSTKLDRNKKNLIIRITDTGLGIPEEIRNKVFHFYETTKDEGTGMGLPIVKHIIETVHKGELRYLSGRKETTFDLYLPL